MSDVVCIGAHPDDVEIGMGATVARMVEQGLSVTIVDLTDGEPTPFGTSETRMREAEEAARILGVTRRCAGLVNRELFDTREARVAVAEILREERPDRLFVPYPVDAHPDHVAGAAIASAARFYAKFTKTEMRGEPHRIVRLYHYMAVHLRLVESPAFIMDVSDQLERKVAALGAYESQFAANPANRGIIPMVEQAAWYWGSMIGAVAGEPFFTPEPIGVLSLEALA